MKKVKLEDLKRALEKSWSRETSADPETWTPDNPSWGQCCVTALVIQDFFGGILLRGAINTGSHYWNKLPDGLVIDLTEQQFLKGIKLTDIRSRSRKYVLSYPDTAKRYNLLKQRVEAEIEKIKYSRTLMDYNKIVINVLKQKQKKMGTPNEISLEDLPIWIALNQVIKYLEKGEKK